MSDILYTGKIGRQDMSNWGGTTTKTFTRAKRGGTETLTQVGAMVDVLAVYGAGTSYTAATLQAAISAVGSASCAFLLNPGTWTVDVDLTFPTNIVLVCPKGVTFSISSGKTLTAGQVLAGTYQIFSGSGTATLTTYPQEDAWWGNTAAVMFTTGAAAIKINHSGLVTTAGDILYFDGTNIKRLAIGSTDQILTVNSGLPVWAGTAAASYTLYTEQAAAPTTAANQGGVYTKDVGGETHLFYKRESEGTECDLSAHQTLHERAGAWEIDGDHLDIDFTPTNYTPDTTPAEAANVDDLAAHFAGLDNGLALLDGFSGRTPQRARFEWARSLDFTSGGTYEVVAGNTITGDISAKTATVLHVELTSGTWAGADAAGTLYVNDQSGAFQSETLSVGANSDVATIGADSSINAVVIHAGAYRHIGTANQVVYWESTIGFEFANLGTSDWSYLYLDDSAIVTAGTALVSASEMVDAVTEPSFSEVKRGWYNGEDRCIFAVLTDGSDNILEFHHLGDIVKFGDSIKIADDVDLDTTWTDYTHIIPIFSRAAIAFIHYACAANISQIHARPNGSTTGGTMVARARGGYDGTSEHIAFTDAAGIAEYLNSISDASYIQLFTNGFLIPGSV